MLLRILKSLGMPSRGRRQSKTSLEKNGVVSFNLKDNENTACRFFSNLNSVTYKIFQVQKINLE